MYYVTVTLGWHDSILDDWSSRGEEAENVMVLGSHIQYAQLLLF